MLQILLLWVIEIATNKGSDMKSACTVLELFCCLLLFRYMFVFLLKSLVPKLTLSLAAKIYRREIYTMLQEGQKQGLNKVYVLHADNLHVRKCAELVYLLFPV